MTIHTCRFCKQTIWSGMFPIGLNYAPRSWAHYGCYFSKRGLRGLTPAQIDRIPQPLLSRYGLFADASRIIDAWRVEENLKKWTKEVTQ